LPDATQVPLSHWRRKSHARLFAAHLGNGVACTVRVVFARAPRYGQTAPTMRRKVAIGRGVRALRCAGLRRAIFDV